ncbi:hypothetical protein ACU5AX_16445 [Sphingomonas sp. XXL09]|uniref:hypothetical protein n=1 Tax=Sphingomonas sp. XXL09 TaxID=3457787 RepID=UPI00406BC348
MAATSKPYVQEDKQFRAAFENNSTSPSFIMITVVEGQSGITKTGCITPATLTHAIEIERELQPDYSLRGLSAEVALAAPDHRFYFQKPETLRAIGFGELEINDAAACDIIRRGKPAFRADRTGQIMVGQP